MPEDAATPGADSELWDLQHLAQATRLCDWMFEQFRGALGTTAVEVGAGIGTFSERMLAAGVERLTLIEPDAPCAGELERRFAGDPRVMLIAGPLPDADGLGDLRSSADTVVCQNVLEHIEDDAAALGSMAAALKPGGRLVLLVPAHPRLFGTLDRRFGHHRRYDRERLERIVSDAGLTLEHLYSFNLLGILGWWIKSRQRTASLDPRSLRAYEALVRVWRPIEDRCRLPVGLSLVAHGRRPANGPTS